MRRCSFPLTTVIIAISLLLLIAFPLPGQQQSPSGNDPRMSRTEEVPSGGTDTGIDGKNTFPLAPTPVHYPITIEPMVVFEEPDSQTISERVIPESTAPQPDNSFPQSTDHRPRVAIIIDDMGNHASLGDKLLALDFNLTYSFLPHAPFTARQAVVAAERGREVLVHLPMEPKEIRWSSDDIVLQIRDSQEDIRRKTLAMLAAVPQAKGANNHMGSRLTEDAEAMRMVIETLKEQNFFFIDSYTSARSKGLITAKQLGVPTARRAVFLDNVQEPRQICRRLEELVAVARQQGGAIGIGHPYEATLQALTECKTHLLESVDLVKAGQMVN